LTEAFTAFPIAEEEEEAVAPVQRAEANLSEEANEGVMAELRSASERLVLRGSIPGSELAVS
jgi:hypothetical protein